MKKLRTTILKVCVTEREAAAYQAAADAMGVCRSTWMRVCANNNAQPQIAALSKGRKS